LRLHLHNADKAKEVINKALEANPKNVKLYLQMLGGLDRKNSPQLKIL
jgi:lipopolysaccharide biosynthesis regulator YciM